jgi:hypothetical protein
MRMELVAAAALVEATAMVADLVVAKESAKVKVITMGPMVEAEVGMMVGSAAVLVVDRGTAAVIQQVTMMVPAMGQRLKIHVVE